jgi:ketosteroid isomerase-like protein
MKREHVRAIAHELFADLARGDIQSFGAKLDENIDWIFHAPMAVFPFAGARRGRDAVLASMLELNRGFKVESQVLETVIADEQASAMVSDVSLTQRATGRTIRVHVAHMQRYRNGKLTTYRGFTDSFDAVEQVLGRWLDLNNPSRA